jgi:hypothetical protein
MVLLSLYDEWLKSMAAKQIKPSLARAGIYRTDKQGIIEFITDGERLWVVT